MGQRCVGAGPFPELGAGGEAGGYGVPFDIAADALEFVGIADPVVEGFVLPDGFSGAAEAGVDVSRGDALESGGDFGERRVRSEEDVDVVGHDDVGVQVIAAQLGATKDGIFGVVCEFAIGEPDGALLGGVQAAVQLKEGFVEGVLGFLWPRTVWLR